MIKHGASLALNLIVVEAVQSGCLGRAPAMSTTRKRKQQEAAGPNPAAAPAPGFAIVCSQESKLLDIDEECFVDASFPDDIEKQCEDSATARDGSWVWDHQPI